MFNLLLVHPLFNLLALIYAVLPGHDFGLAVIIMTALVRLALWPLVTKQLHSQRVLQSLAPQVNKIKQQAKGDRQKESQMLMELYKEKGVNPFSSLGLVLLQLPLFIALYKTLTDVVKAGEIAKVTYEPLKSFEAIKAVIADPAVFEPTLLGLVDLTKPNIVLAVLAAATQYYQSKQLLPQHKPAQGDTSAQAASIATYIFPVLTFGIALTLPSALALYWIVTSAVAIIQQHQVLVRDARELEAGVVDKGDKQA